VETLAERIAWILQHRGFGSRRALGRAARLSAAHISLVAKGERGLSAHSAHAIAAAARVRLFWLVVGEGSPDDAPSGATASGPSPATGPYPRREQALALVQGSVSAQVAAALRLEQTTHDRSLEEWLARASELQRLLTTFRKES
jgi:hypothetical protein